MAEEFAFDQFARNGGHVDGNEGTVAAAAVVVQRAGDEFLAGAAFAGDHHREVGLHQAGQHTVDVLHGGRAADQRIFRLPRAAGGQRRLARCGHRAIDDTDQFVQIEGLGEIFVGAAFGRGDRSLQRVLRAHHHDGYVGPDTLDAGDQVEGVFVGHHHIGDDEVALALADPAPKCRRVAGGADVVADAPERLVENGADCCIVVGEENGSAWHLCSPVSAADRRRQRSRRYAWATRRGRPCHAAGFRIR